jgi:Domain of unknown function (DUF5666)
MNTYDGNDGALSVALADLASSMPDDPYRVEGIHARARRLRTRRRATRAGVGVLVGAATIVGLIAIRPGPSAVTTVPASPSTEQAPAVPACSTLTPPPRPNVAPSQPTDADRAKAAAARTDTEPAVDGFTGVKGYGTVTAVTDSSITVTLAEPAPGLPAEVTAAFTPQTEFYDGGTQATDRPAVNTGDQVGLAAVVNDTGGYDLLLLDAHPPAQPAPPGEVNPAKDVTDAEKAAAAETAPDLSFVKGIATVTAVQADSLTLDVTDGPLAGQSVTATLASDTTYTSGDQKCVDPALAAGQTVGIVLHREDAGTYTAQMVALFAQ